VAGDDLGGRVVAEQVDQARQGHPVVGGRRDERELHGGEVVANGEHAEPAYAIAGSIRRVAGQRDCLDHEGADVMRSSGRQCAVDARRACDRDVVLDCPLRDRRRGRTGHDGFSGPLTHCGDRVRKRGDAADVIPVRVRRENVGDRSSERLRARSDDRELLVADAGVDRHRFAVGDEQQRCRLPESALEPFDVHLCGEYALTLEDFERAGSDLRPLQNQPTEPL
jgi:hypothetical protein